MNENIYPLQFKESDLENGNVNPDGTANFGSGDSNVVYFRLKKDIYSEGETEENNLEEYIDLTKEDAVALMESGKTIMVTGKYIEEGDDYNVNFLFTSPLEYRYGHDSEAGEDFYSIRIRVSDKMIPLCAHDVEA